MVSTFFVTDATSVVIALRAGKLLRIDQMFPTSLERAMLNYGLPEAEVTSAARFIRACLHLNPQERSSAKDLVAHPWLENAYMCC